MVEKIRKEVEKSNVEQLIEKLISDVICDDIRKKCMKIHPLKQVYIHRVKVLKKPKMDCKRSVFLLLIFYS